MASPTRATTTLKLPRVLKTRIAPLAKSAGKSPHAWMVDALEAQARIAEMRKSLVDEALQSAEEIDNGGSVYAMEDVHAYIHALSTGASAVRPAPLAASSAVSSPRRKR